MVIDGRFEVDLPAGASMTVTGSDVNVPGTWTGSDGGWKSPGTGVGYVVTVTSGASLVVRDA